MLTLAVLSLYLLFTSVDASPDGPIINTTFGSYIGASDTANAIDTFFGIRFTSPPARFTPAIPIANPPSGLQSALAFGSDCPQLPGTFISAIAGIPVGPPLRGANQSEDCLFLNVSLFGALRTSAGDKLPILIYIHGGAYSICSGPEWNGTSLVQRSVAMGKPIIFVTINYRLGALGFLGSAQVPPGSLNVGLQDQRTALRFIQDNAESVGGDGSRITISGESAGGASVHMHYLYPDSQRTFRGGISSSGTSLVLNTPAYLWPLALTTYQAPRDILPLWSPFKGLQGSLTQATLDKLLDLYAHPRDNLVLNSSLYNRAAQFTTDYEMLAPERLFLRTVSKGQREQDVWAYEFQQHAPDAPDFLGAFHMSDLYYLDIGFASVPSRTLQSQMQDFYISFTNDLNPGASWPKYTEGTGSGVVMQLLDGDVEPIADTLRLEQTEFLNQVDVMKEFRRFG
ncbi:Alpha/beta-hydrolase [Mycena sanguinolenta]|uniref:Alpha/beta-hydrolase n=1 Tax=Mycena sanguinolenta TaxID=230812 RepID=A0A8H7D9B3_9AGAR|nr:Alpha/beta-hydrolase [Mycena sanguinolenta]